MIKRAFAPKRKWTEQEIEQLHYMVKKDVDVHVMARVFDRTPKAVHCAIWREGLNKQAKESAPVQLELAPAKPKQKQKRTYRKRSVDKNVWVKVYKDKPSLFSGILSWFKRTKVRKAKEVVYD